MNIRILKLDEVFSVIQRDCLNDLYKFGILKNSTIKETNKDFKKLLLHHLIEKICMEFNNSNMQLTVFLYTSTLHPGHEIFSYCDYTKVNLFILKSLHKLNGKLPIIVMKIENYNNLNNPESGEYKTLLSLINNEIYKVRNKSYNFSKIRQFCKNNGLSFLTNDYFTNLKTKQNLMTI